MAIIRRKFLIPLFCLLGSLTVFDELQAAPSACWRKVMRNAATSTRQAVNSCAIRSTDDATHCYSYCTTTRGGSDSTCKSLCWIGDENRRNNGNRGRSGLTEQEEREARKLEEEVYRRSRENESRRRTLPEYCRDNPMSSLC